MASTDQLAKQTESVGQDLIPSTAVRQSVDERFRESLDERLKKLPKSKWRIIRNLAEAADKEDNPMQFRMIVDELVNCIARSDGSPVPTVDLADLTHGEMAALLYRDYVGRRIMELRTALNWTQADLARAVGGTQSYVSRLENGEHQPTGRTIKKFADALGVEPGDLDPARD